MKPHLLLALKARTHQAPPHAMIMFTASERHEFVVTAQQSAEILARSESWHTLEVCSMRVQKFEKTLKTFWATVGVCPHPTLVLAQEWIHYNAGELWPKACLLLAQIEPERIHALSETS